MIRIIAIVLLSILSTNTYAEDIKPFTSDGCSAFPDGTLQQQTLWQTCCLEHDKAYWQGGTYQQRLDTDLALKQCVTAIGEPVIAELMLSGVRVGGSPYWPTKFRWGYGWSYPHGYASESVKKKGTNMSVIITSLIVLITLLHIYFLVLEMFFWTKPLGRKTFKLSTDFAQASKSLAANQGLYNGFLAAGLIWGLLRADAIAIYLFFLSCIAIAGIYGAITVNKRIFFIQALPAIITLGLLILS